MWIDLSPTWLDMQIPLAAIIVKELDFARPGTALYTLRMCAWLIILKQSTPRLPPQGQ